MSRLDAYFDMVADRIHQNRKNGERTLVHCVAGVSRSASLCIVYLIKYDNMTLRLHLKHYLQVLCIFRFCMDEQENMFSVTKIWKNICLLLYILDMSLRYVHTAQCKLYSSYRIQLLSN